MEKQDWRCLSSRMVVGAHKVEKELLEVPFLWSNTSTMLERLWEWIVIITGSATFDRCQ